jgi:hypothetical protein
MQRPMTLPSSTSRAANSVVVPVAPAKRDDLAAPHARRKPGQRYPVQPPSPERLKDGLDLIGREDLDLGALDPRRLSRGHRVDDHDTPFDGMTENAMKQAVHMPDRARREAGAFWLRLLQFPVQLGEI